MKRAIGWLMTALLVLAAAPDAAAQRRSTRFDVQKFGFRFANTFSNDFLKDPDIRTGGLCGGMVYAALDYYHAKRRAPSQTYRPANRTPLQSYIYNRQLHSFKGLDKWVEIGLNPGGIRNDEFFRWGLKERLAELRKFLDRGQPVPLGLWGSKSESHQVLAIGYDMGRYKGDLGANQGDLKIFVYDPNHPKQTLTLVPDPRRKRFFYLEQKRWKPADRIYWRSYFPDGNYRPRRPPNIRKARYPKDGRAHELVLRFATGADDLRGGRDNVNVTLNLANGTQQRYLRINKGARWLSNYAEHAQIKLKRPAKPEDILSVEVQTTFRGGIGGDNWDVVDFQVWATGGRFVNRHIYHNKDKFRFTGHRKNRTYTIRELKHEAGKTKILTLNIQSGSDDLRGGNDNVDAYVMFRGGGGQWIRNINASRNWERYRPQKVHLTLNRPMAPKDIVGLKLQTTSRGGMGGDNWDLRRLEVQANIPGKWPVLYKREKRPYIKRFTGNDRSFTARW
ncbi:MAG: hypothetical protein KJO07_10180 [Deltaproteobacteria bacterium]|nr:hypothetical protein [Deltaproteobacteria bacterium]